MAASPQPNSSRIASTGRPKVWVDTTGDAPIAREERRTNVRIRERLPLLVRADGVLSPALQLTEDGESSPTWTPGIMRNISVKGVGFATRLPLEIGQRAIIDIEFDSWTFRSRSQVRFVRPVLGGLQVGCEFTDVSDADRERLVAEVFAVQRARARERMVRDSNR